jgi:hypothetical protein
METDNTYVPVSARVDFKLQAWKDAEELPEFTLLQTETSTLVKDIQAQLKTKIIQNIRLDQTVLSASIAKHHCESIAAALSLFLVANGKIPPMPVQLQSPSCNPTLLHSLSIWICQATTLSPFTAQSTTCQAVQTQQKNSER